MQPPAAVAAAGIASATTATTTSASSTTKMRLLTTGALLCLAAAAASSPCAGRQRFHKKYCTNVNGELSRQLVNDYKCIVDKKLAAYRKIDSDFGNTLLELVKRNYSDAGVELKYLCCTIINYRRAIIEAAAPECSSSRPRIEEMIMSTVSSEINLICEDEEALVSKVCPKLEPIKLPGSFQPKAGEGPSATSLYLVATLGEPETS